MSVALITIETLLPAGYDQNISKQKERHVT